MRLRFFSVGAAAESTDDDDDDDDDDDSNNNNDMVWAVRGKSNSLKWRSSQMSKSMNYTQSTESIVCTKSTGKILKITLKLVSKYILNVIIQVEA